MKLMKYKATTSSPCKYYLLPHLDLHFTLEPHKASDEIEISFANGEPLKVLDDTRHSEKEDGTTGRKPPKMMHPPSI